MIESIFSAEYVFNLICLNVAFFTFVKLVSNDVYLTNHRILPTIAGLMIIYNFYVCIIPLLSDGYTVEFFHLLCDLCSLVIMYMMFFYFLFIKKPKGLIFTVIVSLLIMTALCVYNSFSFYMMKPKSVFVDFVAVLIVFLGCVFIELISPSPKYFDRTDRIIGRYMMLAFVIALLGYFLHDVIMFFGNIRSLAFLIDCIIFYWLAKTNRIEDTGTILKSTIFDRMEYPIALVNSQFYVVDANQKALELFPFGSEIEFAFDGGTSNGKFKLCEQLVHENRNDEEFFALDRWYRIHYTPVEAENRIKGYIFSATDITEQHNEAINAKKEAVKKSRFLAQMSHELRTPLHAIIGISDILSGNKDISEKNKTLISHIKRASDNLLELVNAILDYSKLEAGKFEFSERVYDVNTLFEDLSYATILNIQSKPIDFNLAVTTSFPRYLYGDAVRVREILQNILSNAVKFTEKGSIHGEISFTRENDRWRIDFSIADTGSGMTPKQISEIFNEYVSSADGNSTEGTGLGLAIVKQLVSKMAGSVMAESDGISGSVLKGHFYQSHTESELYPEKVFNRRSVMNQSTGLHGMPDRVNFVYPKASILVADDMKINLEIIKQLLAPWKCEVITVPDGAAAIRAVKERKFDMVMLDQMMMPISGPEACEKIREFSDVPIILVTADSEDNARAVAKESNFTDYLGKPILGKRLTEVVETYLPKALAEENTADTAISVVKRNRMNNNVYYKTLEAFIKEMQPLLLKLPNYRKTEQEMFKVKVHGIAGVSKQIGRDTFADFARVMEMAAKSETWAYVDEHMDEFINSLCEVVDDATKELSQLAPEYEKDEYDEVRETYDVTAIINNLYRAFDDYNLNGIEDGLEQLYKVDKDQALENLFDKLKGAYDNLEYDDGVAAIDAYNKSK